MQHIEMKSFCRADIVDSLPRGLQADRGTIRAQLRNRLTPAERAIMDRCGLWIGAAYIVIAIFLVAIAYWDAAADAGAQPTVLAKRPIGPAP